MEGNLLAQTDFHCESWQVCACTVCIYIMMTLDTNYLICKVITFMLYLFYTTVI